MNEKFKKLLISDVDVQDFYLPENLEIFKTATYTIKLVGKNKRENKLFKNDHLVGLLESIEFNEDDNKQPKKGLLTFIDQEKNFIKDKNEYYLDFKEYCQLVLKLPEFSFVLFDFNDVSHKPVVFNKNVLLKIYDHLYRNLKIYTSKETSKAYSLLTPQLIKIIKKERNIHSAYYTVILDENDEDYAVINLYFSFVHINDTLSKTTYRLIKRLCAQELMTRNIFVYVDQSLVANHIVQNELEPFYIKKRGFF